MPRKETSELASVIPSMSKLETNGWPLLALLTTNSLRKRAHLTRSVTAISRVTAREKVPSAWKSPCVSSADILTLLRNPVAPLLTIGAYTNLRSQIFLTSSDVWSRNSQSKSSSASLFSLFFISKLKSRSYQFFPPNIPHTCHFLSISTAATFPRGLGTSGPGYRTAS